jgi:hypothetical protein
MRVGKAKRAHRMTSANCRGGHGAHAPLPTLHLAQYAIAPYRLTPAPTAVPVIDGQARDEFVECVTAVIALRQCLHCRRVST